MVFFWTWCNEWCCRVQLHPSNRGWWFFEWGLFLRWVHHYRNQYGKWVSATSRLEWRYQSSKNLFILLFWKLAGVTYPDPKKASIENKSQWQAIVMPNGQWSIWWVKNEKRKQVNTNNEHKKIIHKFNDLQINYLRRTALNNLLIFWTGVFCFSVTLFYSTLLAITDGQKDRQRDKYTHFAWAGRTFFPVVLLCKFFVLAGNMFWFYILLCT